MARFDERSGQLYMTELGRVASHFYIRHASIVAFEEHLQPRMSQAQVRRPLSLNRPREPCPGGPADQRRTCSPAHVHEGHERGPRLRLHDRDSLPSQVLHPALDCRC